MKRPALIVAAAGALLCTLPALAQNLGAVKPEDRNAAIKYSWAYFGIPDELTKRVGEVDWSKVGFSKDAESQPKEYQDAVAAIGGGEASIQMLVVASRLRRCDNEIEYEKGIGALLPHLTKARTAARVLRLDARRTLIAGDADASAERLAAIVRMGKHTTGDQTMISSLVGAAMVRTATEEVAAQLESGLLTPEARATLLKAFRGLDASDPFFMKGAIRGERLIFLDWIKREFAGADAGKRFMEIGAMMGTGGPKEAEAARTISAMNGDQLALSVDLLTPYYDQVLEAWDKPDGAARLGDLERRVKAGEFGPLGYILAPSMSKGRDSSLKIQAEVEGIIDRLSAE